jgi:6-pyruvoyltetrahydropterin/6-carboxytetrahydropterin synthase
VPRAALLKSGRMLILTRTVRFAVNPPELGPIATLGGPNGYAGSPPVRGLGRHYELSVTCAGEPDPVTGYLINIKDVDGAVREQAVPLITRACAERAGTDPADLMGEILGAVASGLPGEALRTVRWWVSPYHSLEMARSDPGVVLLRQKFDFSASHRLHTPALSEEENRRLYGKCNNPSGHGHNYQFEPCVAVPVPRGPTLRGGNRGNGPDPAAGRRATQSFSMDDLERLAEETIIRRFDHRNLNVDTPEFAPGDKDGLIPSVENIARVFYTLLAPAVTAAGAELRSITVWETDRTSSTYPG